MTNSNRDSMTGDAQPCEYLRRAWRLALALTLAAALIFTLLNVGAPLAAGDSSEYLTMTQSWFNHASPDARPKDFSDVTQIAQANGLSNPRPKFGYFRSPRDGREYSWHFWVYSLFAVPLKAVLRALAVNEFLALSLTNTLLFFVALFAVFRVGVREELARRIAAFTLCAASPILWYLRWPTPEVSTWCGVLLCLLFLDAKRFTLAALCASLAAMQNPPVLFLTFFVLACAFCESRTAPPRARWRVLAPVVAATALSFLPNIFYLGLFGQSSLILSRAYGGIDWSLLSPARVISFLFDLNQGALPYVPVTLFLVAAAWMRAIKTRDAMLLGAFASLFAMILACCLNAHWNVGEAGMRRYLAWMMPLLAWIALRGTCEHSKVSKYALLAVLTQLGMVATHDGSQFFKSHTPWGAQVLNRQPRFYNPDFLIFIERSPKRTLSLRQALPVAWLDEHGDARKLLCDTQSLPQLQREFDVESGFLEILKEQVRREKGLPFYAHPPLGAVRATPQTAKIYRDYHDLWGRW